MGRYGSRSRSSSAWPEYVPAAQRRAKAAREVLALQKNGSSLSPVRLTGITIASTFWGKSWCENLERYSDYSNRLPRGRAYVRNGAVIDLRLEAGKIVAQVMGTRRYCVEISISALDAKVWESIRKECSGQIASLIELLQGRFSRGVMEVLTRPVGGMFPRPSEIKFKCSCPDWALMCKHVAAVLYGIGARLDSEPELLFLLRKVDQGELLAQVAASRTDSPPAISAERRLDDDSLSSLFGIELVEEGDAGPGEGATAAPDPVNEEISAPRARKKPARARTGRSRTSRSA